MTTDQLPQWDEMSDLDKGCALLHIWKRHREGRRYAIENYPCRYADDPRLVALDGDDASQHARDVVGIWDAARDRLGERERYRLYNLALDHGAIR